MSSSFWAKDGSFIPFPRPIPALTSDPMAASDVGICFSADWLPPVLGALKALCRPESWSGSDADVVAAMRSSYSLLAAFGTCTGAILFPPIACDYNFFVSESQLGWQIVLASGHPTANFPGAGFRSEDSFAWDPSNHHQFLSIIYAVGVGGPTYVDSVTLRYTAVDEMSIALYDRSSITYPYGSASLLASSSAPPGVVAEITLVVGAAVSNLQLVAVNFPADGSINTGIALYDVGIVARPESGECP